VATQRSASAGADAGIRGIETRSIDYVPASERHGRVWQQGPFWFVGNFQFFTLTIGFIGVSLGLSARDTVIAGTLGITFGTLFMAFHATQGPHLGLPQMIQSRGQLGYSGVLLALFGSFVMYMLFNVIDVILLASGLNATFGWDPALVGVVTTVVAAVLAIYGHDVLHRVFRFLFLITLPLYVILSLAVFSGRAGGSAEPIDEFTWTAFMAMFTVSAAYNITYAPYVSDYSRYLPRSTRTAPIVASVFLGAAGAAIWLIALGAWLASGLGTTDALVSLRAAGDDVVGGFGSLVAIVSVAAGVAAMGLNAYGAMLSTATALDSVRRIKPTRRLRVVTICILAAIWGIAGIAFGGSAVGAVYNGLIVMLYLLVPWTAINLVDYFLVRRGRYSILDLFDPEGIYGRWGWRGLSAFVIGLVAMAPFYVVPGVYTGPAAELLGGVDISAIVGLAVAGLVYFLFTRALDVSSEQSAIEASERTIAAELP
jgi:nucleobase:cation symporter-1, NCS1 family